MKTKNPETALKILITDRKEDEKFLRRKASPFDFFDYSRKEINDLIKKMRLKMIKSQGIGLAANQAGLDMRLFVAQVRGEDGAEERGGKFYAIFNPEIVKFSKEKSVLDEGCLSVEGGIYGGVERSDKITLIGYDKNGKKIKIKAWGLLARIFQHEVDHLNGILFIDKAAELRKLDIKNKVNRDE